MRSLLILVSLLGFVVISLADDDSGEHVVDVNNLGNDLTKDLGSDVEDFKKFNKRFNKKIKQKDFKKAAKAFKENNSKLKALQEKNKGKKFKLKMNRFMALPEEEFQSTVLISPTSMKFNSKTRAIDRKEAKKLRQAKRKAKQEERKKKRLNRKKEKTAKKAGKQAARAQAKAARQQKRTGKKHKRDTGEAEVSEVAEEEEPIENEEWAEETNTEEEPYDPRIDDKLPEKFDWRDYGVITPVKDQSTCGSCWTFSANGVLEAQHARKHPGELLDLSEQQIMTCVSPDRLHICKGGKSEDVFEYFLNNSLVTEAENPYTPSKTITPRDAGCKKIISPKVKVASHVSLRGSTVDEIKDALIQDGPISVGVYLNPEFDYYAGGLFDAPCTDHEAGGHAMIIVGYGKEDDGTPYWIIKNSWGEDWGEGGYIKWKMGDNLCSVESKRLNQAQIV
ncbi:unnamed protein product, partial [Mesorhabditis belari]|uniref:Peptidase C1A papain C-terminal domain-containing protein n=1 Tax=Mesorhabditis belari TaxID=2138241 RepID=A0AAF3ELQ2_9BILA